MQLIETKLQLRDLTKLTFKSNKFWIQNWKFIESDHQNVLQFQIIIIKIHRPIKYHLMCIGRVKRVRSYN